MAAVRLSRGRGSTSQASTGPFLAFTVYNSSVTISLEESVHYKILRKFWQKYNFFFKSLMTGLKLTRRLLGLQKSHVIFINLHFYKMRHDITKPTVSMCPAKTQISLSICPHEESLDPLATYWVHSEDSDQTGRIRSGQSLCCLHEESLDPLATHWAQSEDSDQTGRIRSDQSLCCLHEESLDPLATHWAHSEDSDQTGGMPSLIWVFAGRTLILLVLSCRGSSM